MGYGQCIFIVCFDSAPDYKINQYLLILIVFFRGAYMYQCGVFEEFQYTTYSHYQPLFQYLYFLFILGFLIYTDEII